MNQLKYLGVLTVKDLLFYFPARYDDLSQVVPIGKVRVGERAVVRGRIELIESTRSKWRRKLLTQAVVGDGSGSIRVVWFNQPWIAKMFKRGDEVYLVGYVKDDGGGMYFSSPVYEKVGKRAATHAARLVPVYPSTEKLSQKQLRFLVRNVLPLSRAVLDPLPHEVRARYTLAPLPAALAYIHFPPDGTSLEKARRRLKFDELFRLQLFAFSLKRELKKIPAPRVEFQEETTKRFVEGLPFQLTEDQRKSAWEVIKDLEKALPMNRLLEGDVGSGKTVVVAIAALNTVLGADAPSPQPSPAGRGGLSASPLSSGEGQGEGRGQVAIMAPTEILARQHFGTFARILTPYNVCVGLLTHGAVRISESGIMNHELGKKEMVKKMKEGEVDVIVGTHALIQKDAHFKNLILAVVDEQHRFGVEQRAALKEKRSDGLMPHLLTLTATPIPRSLALVFYGDLDISVLREMPKGRKRIETVLVADAPHPHPLPRGEGAVRTPSFPLGDGISFNSPLPLGEGQGEGKSWSRKQAHEFVRSEVAAGHQVFWTCPIIDPSDTLGVKAATEVFEHLRDEIFTDLKVGLIHGRMKPKEREKVMEEFASPPRHPDPEPCEGEGSRDSQVGRDSSPSAQNDKAPKIDILIATPVIEVGIDVPNATVMVIEGAERFGLAQLHQFRGRVGRSEAKSHCLLMVEGEPNARIQAFLESQDGFALAEKDLELRGPGEVYSGTAQSGFPEFKIASFADVEIAKQAREAASQILAQDPELRSYPQLKAEIMQKEGKTHLE